MFDAGWTEEDMIKGYQMMAQINLAITLEFTPLEEEAEKINFQQLK